MSLGAAMRVLHVIPSLSPTQGGPSMALPAMARALVARGVGVDVAATDDDGRGQCMKVVHGSPIVRDGWRVFFFPKQTEFYKVSWPLLRWLWQHVRDYQVVHVHTVFSFATLAAGWCAILRGVPFIVRPLGVLNTWGMENRRRWIKQASFRLLDKPLLDRAAAMHYTSGQERAEAARLKLRARAVVLPLGFDLAAMERLQDAALFHQHFPQTTGKKVVLFLSRLDPKKNVSALLEAISKVSCPGAHLVIAGSGSAAHEAELRVKAATLGLEQRITWAGHLEGMLKLSAFAAASLYVLPSHSENFGIALLEAMAAGLPCISTPGVALAAEAAAVGAVLLAEAEASSLAQAIQRLLDDPGQGRQLGKCARQTAFERYSLDVMGARLEQLYREITSA